MKQSFLKMLSSFLFLLSVFQVVQAQKLKGTVLDDEKRPILGAYVKIESLDLATATDSSGVFYFFNVSDGEFKVKVTHIGYASQTKTVMVPSASDKALVFTLKFSSTELSDIFLIGSSTKNNSNRITKEYLELAQAIDLKDIFLGEPSVTIGGGSANAQRLYLRGIEGSNLNITIDGAKQGRSLFQHRGNAGNLDAALLKQVEVSTGGDATQGVGGLGGSIAFETVDAQDVVAPSNFIGGKVMIGLSGVSDGYNARAILGAKFTGNLGLVVSVATNDQENYRTKSGLIPNTAAKNNNYFAKLSLLNYHHHNLRLSSTLNQGSGYYILGGAGSDMGIPNDTLAAQYQVTTRSSYTLDYRFSPGNRWLSIKANAYYNHRNLDNDESEIDVTSNNIGGTFKNELSVDWDKLNNNFTIGTDYDKEEGISASATSLGGTEQTNISTNWGAFLQGNSNISMVSVSYGIRRDEYSSGFGPVTLDGNKYSPNAGINIEPLKGLQLFCNYSEAVRVSGTIPIQWMANITGDTNFNDGKVLEPETSVMKQGGLNYLKTGLFTSDDKLVLGAKFFETEMDNLIERVGGGGGLVTKIWNDTLGVISKGYDLSLSWSNKKINTSLSFMHVDIKNINGEMIQVGRRKVAPTGDRFNWSVLWKVNSEIQLGYRLNSVSKLQDVYDTERPGYVLHNIQALWKPASIRRLTTSVVVNNLFDKEYSEQTSIESGGTIMPEPGRDIRVSLSYNF